MICYKCGKNAGTSRTCPYCDADLSAFVTVQALSVSHYNEGYYQAGVRNISGAIYNLEESLKYDKGNIQARNLLGLCYYEVGELVYALREWVISENLQPAQNPATRYLQTFKDDAALRNQMDTTIRKYNQAVAYCRNNSRDMAIMQLKKVVSLNPKLVKAHQLLALLYIQEGQLEKAKKQLRLADRIDATNPITLRYLKEVNRKAKEAGGRKKGQEEELLTYQNGNETVIMPRRFRENNVGQCMRYLLAGLVGGCLITGFLFIPQAVKNAKNQMQGQMVEASDTLISNSQEIDELESRIDDMQGEISDAQGNEDDAKKQVIGYQALLEAYQYAVEGNEDAVLNLRTDIDTSKLDEKGLVSYHALYDTLAAKWYSTGYNLIMSDQFAESLPYFRKVCSLDMSYKTGSAAYYLGLAYYETDDRENARTYLQYVVDNYPGSQYAEIAKTLIPGGGSSGEGGNE